MNQGVVQSSPVQQMVAAGGWSINNMRPPPLHQHHSFVAAPSYHHLAPPSVIAASSWNDSQDLPPSWSQLLLGGLVGEEDKPASLSHMQARKLEIWDQHLNFQTSNGSVDLKKENSDSSNTYGVVKHSTNNSWSPHHQMVSASSPNSCVTTLSNNVKSADGKHPHQDLSSECNSTATGGLAKKPRIQPSLAQSTFKVRKEKLGDRITALHQLVSPFGKTDTASVLLEAIGYIRFLQSQIEALSSPYLGTGSGSIRQRHPIQGERNCLFPEDPGQLLHENCIKRKGVSDLECNEEPKKDLRSRGLCLVPISCTLDVGSENGADYWASAFGANFP
ncbi:hypothetical protein CDL12_15094 [Handroanthus impetiginosus]|uniref:BHLH domain-containing protein n=1 Tax=Handroanthus impetiginosus TaxID=429701 RepID=A0A2G9H454_9LAMI|nr:hypothetical protein CDL12_15094 [Handroanthus impetiginosus]